MLKRRIAVAAAGVALALSVPLSAPAQSASWDCRPASGFCWWNALNFPGHPWYSAPVPSGQCVRIAGVAWSVYNRSPQEQRVWEFDNCTGRNVLVGIGQAFNLSFGAHGRGGY
ncbi:MULTISPECIES: peptidase inhibitor family I36 protein [unclassified Nonomuraea]|uniref:peptidase inhibitor family I36 protein n=1 Tax=unclassified Nonomuraea TaxID=2593643 RepID=UPI0035C261A3